MNLGQLMKKKRLANPYILLGLLFLLIAGTVDQTKDHPIAIFMFIGIAVLCCAAVILFAAGKLTEKNVLILLIAAGVLLRVGYALYTPYTLRQHDVRTFDGKSGHAVYIRYIAEHLSLPDTNTPWQFYHPPLHHILAALWLKLNLALGFSMSVAYENIQLLPCFYSCLSLLVCLKIFKELALPRRAVILGMAVISFHPTFIILAGSLNNDMLMILFSLAVILCAIRWYQDSSMKNMALTGLFLGLAMMTKVSAVILAPMLAFLFIVKAWKQRKQMGLINRQCIQGIVFCGISIPLGMWYPIRNLVLFGQAFFYIPGISRDFQYIGNYGLADRLWNIPWEQLLSPYQDWSIGYNIPLSLIKTATFGEDDFGLWPIGNILLYVNILLILLSVFAMLRVLFCKIKNDNTVLYQSLGIVWIVLMISYTDFCLAYPSICTQDFRYVVPTILTGSLFLGVYTAEAQGGSALKKAFSLTTTITVTLFCIFSTAVYIALGIG